MLLIALVDVLTWIGEVSEPIYFKCSFAACYLVQSEPAFEWEKI